MRSLLTKTSMILLIAIAFSFSAFAQYSPTKLMYSGVSPADPVTNCPFAITINATDNSGVPQDVDTDTEVAILQYWGNGTLAGTFVQTMYAGTHSVTFDDITYTAVEGVLIKFQPISGMALDSSKQIVNIKQGPVTAKILDVYNKAYVNVTNHTFTVRALNSDGNPNMYYDGYDVELKMVSGPGNFVGTTVETAMNGVAIFDNLAFDTPGNYVFTATVPGLADPMSVTVMVYAVPTFTELIVPQYIKGVGTYPGNGRTPQYALVRFSNLQANTEYSFITTGMDVADVPTSYVGAGNNFFYDYTNDSYTYNSSMGNLNNASTRSTFKTGSGQTTKDIWVNLVPTSDSKFDEGNSVVWCVYLGNEFGDQISRNTTTNTSFSIKYGTSTNDATGLYDYNSRVTEKHYLVFKDMYGVTLTAAIVQDDGAYLGQGPYFYSEIDNSETGWGTFLPNNLSSGLGSIVEYDKNGQELYTWTDTDGIWAGVNTINPYKGATGINFQTPHVTFSNLTSGQSLCNEGSFDFVWDYSGVSTLTIQVSVDLGETWTTIVAGYPAAEGHYNWLIQRTTYSDKELMFRIYSDEHPEVNEYLDGVNIFDTPEIDHFSKGEVYCIGTEVTIEVVAEGTGIQYQWYRDGVLMPGENLPYLYWESISYSNTGIYHCVITGGAGCADVETDGIVVYVARETAIAKQPQAMFVNLGASAFLEVDPAANGIPVEYKYYYQWYANGIAMVDDARIQGTNSRKLIFNSTVFADLNKEYSCKVSALCGIAYSDTVSLVQTDISIVTQPQDQRFCAGEDVTFNATVQNNKNLDVKYFWYKGQNRLVNLNNKISGANTTTLTIYNIQESDMGSYSLVVEIIGETYNYKSMSAFLFVVTPPVITFQSEDLTIEENSPINLEVKYRTTTTQNLISWKKDGADLGVSTAQYYKASASTDDAGYYICTIQNECGIAESNPIKVNVTIPGITGVEEVVAGEVLLSAPQPNPASDFAQISYNLPAQTAVTFTVTDMFGKTIATFEQNEMNAGVYQFNLNVKDLNITSGIYFINLRTNFGITSQKLIVLE
ncbi:MAG: hypothetical protein A2X64_10735 [Ignavibacteria bacterium GWF2_33_9]|nr:MAG: hypothetical protein A2X64_10735 [Ignavibacteria bacterium GWF2_33_9]